MLNLEWNKDGAEIIKGMFSSSKVLACKEKILGLEKSSSNFADEFVFENFKKRNLLDTYLTVIIM